MNREFIRLRKITWTVLVLFLLIMAGTACVSTRIHLPGAATRLNSLIALMGSVCGSVAFPILIRSLFYNRSLRQKGLGYDLFFRMKIISILSLGAGMLFIIFSLLLPVFRYHLYLSVFSGIYGIYSLLPFRDSLARDVKSFGVAHGDF